MKIPLSAFCWVCFNQTDISPETYQRMKAEDVFVEMNDEGVYPFTCSNGHETFTLVQQEKFEILFDLGAMAILDGYAREAVSSLAASLENFYSFYIRVISSKFFLKSRDVEQTLSLVKLSERKLGAFYLAYLMNSKEKPPVLSGRVGDFTDPVQFRNKVIHEGYIATTADVVLYGNILLRYIFDLLIELNVKDEAFLDNALQKHHIAQRAKLPNQVPLSVASIPSIIGLRSTKDPSFGTASFQEALESIANNSFYKLYYQRR
jgi:hypothetical protein